MYMKIINLFAAFVIAAVSTHASAKLLELDSAGTFEPMASTNDFFYGAAAGYDIGGNLYATALIDITFTYLGHEAGYNNDFNAYGGNLNNKTHSEGASFTVNSVAAGLLDFNFYSNTISQGIANGNNQDFASFQSFATILDYTYNGIFYDAIILFDDSGAGPDDNHDDHIIGIRVAAVSEPGTLGLVIIGVACLIATRRRLARS